MSEDGFHEIQLNGKQLIFLFMAAAVVAVVVFLSGVMVGRGVRVEKAAAALSDIAPDAAAPAAAATGGAAAPATSGAPGATAAAPPATPPPPVHDELSYYDRLEKPAAAAPGKPPEPAPPAPEQAAEAPVAGSSQPAPEPAKTAQKPEPASASAPPAGSAGYSVQVIAMRERSSSEAIAKRLAGKGYSAYVLDPTPGSRSTLYRVRVGPYKTRREAEDAKARLEKEERFKPSITR